MPALTTGGTFGAGKTFMFISSVSFNPPLSVTIILNVRVPAVVSPVMLGFNIAALLIVAAVPAICIHAIVVIVPSSVAVAFNCAELVGNWIVISIPASTTGALLTGAALTVKRIVSVPVAPSLSVAVKMNLYVPASKFVSTGFNIVASDIV